MKRTMIRAGTRDTAAALRYVKSKAAYGAKKYDAFLAGIRFARQADLDAVEKVPYMMGLAEGLDAALNAIRALSSK